MITVVVRNPDPRSTHNQKTKVKQKPDRQGGLVGQANLLSLPVCLPLTLRDQHSLTVRLLNRSARSVRPSQDNQKRWKSENSFTFPPFQNFAYLASRVKPARTTRPC